MYFVRQVSSLNNYIALRSSQQLLFTSPGVCRKHICVLVLQRWAYSAGSGSIRSRWACLLFCDVLAYGLGLFNGGFCFPSSGIQVTSPITHHGLRLLPRLRWLALALGLDKSPFAPWPTLYLTINFSPTILCPPHPSGHFLQTQHVSACWSFSKGAFEDWTANGTRRKEGPIWLHVDDKKAWIWESNVGIRTEPTYYRHWPFSCGIVLSCTGACAFSCPDIFVNTLPWKLHPSLQKLRLVHIELCQCFWIYGKVCPLPSPITWLAFILLSTHICMHSLSLSHESVLCRFLCRIAYVNCVVVH